MDFEFILNNLETRVWIKDDKNNVLYLNNSAAKSMGGKASEFEGRNSTELFPEMADRYHEDDMKVINSGKPLEEFLEKYTPKGKKSTWAKTRKIPITYENQKCVLVLSYDITDHISYENLLQSIFKISHEELSLSKRIQTSLQLINEFLNIRTSFIVNVDEFSSVSDGSIEYASSDKVEDLNKYFIEIVTLLDREKKHIDKLFNKNSLQVNISDEISDIKVRSGKIRHIVTTPINIEDDLYGYVVFFLQERKPNGLNDQEKFIISYLANWISYELKRERDFLRLKTSNERLNLAIENLEKSNMDVESFSYLASHDLREPIRTINSFINLLEKNISESLDETSQEYMDFIKDAGNRMNALVSDMLDYAKVNKVSGKKEEVDLNDIIFEDIYMNLKSLIDGKQAVIKIHPLPVININSIDITRIFQNLIANAIKYSSEDKAPIIEAGYEEDKEYFTFYVKDNGIGIKEEYFESIFKPFSRLHSHSEIEGSGVGLAICKKIIEKNKGEMWVESEIGVGTTFSFKLPK